MKQMSILVVGSVALDSIKTPFSRRANLLGGSATYFSIAASLFCKVNLVACIGTDIGDGKLSLLKRKNIDLKGLKIENGATFRWNGEYFYDMNSRKTTSLELNVFKDFKPYIPDGYASSDFVFLANIDPDLQSEILSRMDSPKLVACDTMDHWIENKRGSLLELLKQVDIFISNDSEARELAKTPNLKLAAKWILSQGPEVIVIKKGEHGVCLVTKKDIFLAPAYPLDKVVDPTGAGDSFAGGFLGYLSRSCTQGRGLPRLCTNGRGLQILRRATVYGSALASFCVESFGVTRLARVKFLELDRRVREMKRLAHFSL